MTIESEEQVTINITISDSTTAQKVDELQRLFDREADRVYEALKRQGLTHKGEEE